MTSDELYKMVEQQKIAMSQQAMNQNVVPTYAQYAAQQAAQLGIQQSNYGLGQWATTASHVPRELLKEREREEIKMQEREACAQLVVDMAEELGCPNLLHGVALAIKSRRGE